MRNLVQHLTLKAKITLLGAGGVVVTLLALVLLAVWQSGQYNTLAQHEVDKLIRANLDNITRDVLNLVRTEHEAAQKELQDNLNVARHLLETSGGMRFSSRTQVWRAVNQFTGATHVARLPGVRLGSREVFPNCDIARETPVVDQVMRLVGNTATVFQRMHARGDMLRIATTVQNAQGQRAVGTYIPAVNPEGQPNPVLQAVLAGKPYRGRAYVVDQWYLTAYEPIWDAQGRVVGMLYVGVRQRTVEARVRQAILQTPVGETGYVYVVTGRGEDRGHYVISQRGERDGEDIWGIQDSDGNFVTQAVVAQALALKPGALGMIRYRWLNPGEAMPRWKIACLAYFEPWDWVIGTSVYEDELQGFRAVLQNGRSRMIRTMTLAGAVLALAVGLLGIFASWTLTRPLKRMTQAVEAFLRGDLAHPIVLHTRDEIGTLAQAFNLMSSRLSHTLQGLRESEQKYREIFEGALEGILQVTPEGRIVSANPAMARALGYGSPEALLEGVSMPGLFVRPTGWNRLLRQLEQEGNALFEAEWFRKDGSVMWANVKASAARDAGGRLIRIDSLAEDMTARKRAEEALHQVNAVQSLILDNSSMGILFVKNRCIAWANKWMESILGRTAQELQGASVRIIYDSEEAFERIGNLAYPALNRGERFEAEIRAARGDGRAFWARILGKVLDPELPQEGSIWLFEDIDERKRAEEAFQRIHEVQSLILDNSTVGIAFVRHRRFVWTNPRLPEMVGLSPEQFLDAPTRIIYPDDAAYERLAAAAYPVLAQGKKAQVDLQVKRSDGSLFWCHFEGKALDPSQPHEGSIWLFEDIDDRKQAEEALEHYRAHLEELVELRTVQLREAKEEAEAATRAKSVFLANMSHELRTPLNAVIGYAQLMARASQDPETRGNLHRILHAGEHLLGLINDVLSLSRIEAGRLSLNPSPFLAEPCFMDIGAMMSPRAQAKGLGFQLELPPALPKALLGDAQKLRQVLVNLLGNAIKFTEQGQVTLRVTLMEGGLRFDVEDTGIGMSPEEQTRLFQPFVQVGDTRWHAEGTGLGLHISQAMVRLMGGEIRVASEHHQGSRFTFELQLPEAEPPMQAIRTLRHLRPDSPRPRQLVVDDVEDNRELLRTYFQSLGLEVRVARDGLEALAQWEAWEPEMVWMDLRMPQCDGWEATRRLRGREGALGRAHTTLIALTASALDLDLAQLRGNGFDDCVLKPIQEARVFQMLETYGGAQFVEETAPASPEVTQVEIRDLDLGWVRDFSHQLALGDTEGMLALVDLLEAKAVAAYVRSMVQDYRFAALKELFGDRHG